MLSQLITVCHEYTKLHKNINLSIIFWYTTKLNSGEGTLLWRHHWTRALIFFNNIPTLHFTRDLLSPAPSRVSPLSLSREPLSRPLSGERSVAMTTRRGVPLAPPPPRPAAHHPPQRAPLVTLLPTETDSLQPPRASLSDPFTSYGSGSSLDSVT